MVRTFPGKGSRNPEIVEFSKSEPFNRKLRKLQAENQMEQKFLVKIVSKIWVDLRNLSFFSEIM